jgi:hypothetical protein
MKPKIANPLEVFLIAALTVAVPAGSAWATWRYQAERAIAAAKAAQSKATAAGAASVNSARLIKEAQGLLPSRQYTKARQLARKAKELSETALQNANAKQAESTAKAKAGAAASRASARAPTGTAAPSRASAQGPAAGSSADVEKAIAAAELARKRAASAGGEWRDIGSIIKKAKAAAASGHYADAVRLADQARRQGDLGYEQAMHQQKADFPPYMK